MIILIYIINPCKKTQIKVMKVKPQAKQYSVKPLTLPKEFNLSKPKSKPTTQTTHSQLLPSQSSLSSLPTKKKLLNSLTIPQSPFLQTKLRSHTTLLKSSEERSYEAFKSIEPFQANPLPNMATPKKPRILRKALTLPYSPKITKSTVNGRIVKPKSKLRFQEKEKKEKVFIVPYSIYEKKKFVLPVFETRVIEEVENSVETESYNPYKPTTLKSFKATSPTTTAHVKIILNCLPNKKQFNLYTITIIFSDAP